MAVAELERISVLDLGYTTLNAHSIICYVNGDKELLRDFACAPVKQVHRDPILLAQAWFDRLNLPDARDVHSVYLYLSSSLLAPGSKVCGVDSSSCTGYHQSTASCLLRVSQELHGVANKKNTPCVAGACAVVDERTNSVLCSFDYAFAVLTNNLDSIPGSMTPGDYYFTEASETGKALQCRMRHWSRGHKALYASAVQYLLHGSPNYVVDRVFRATLEERDFYARLVRAMTRGDADRLWAEAPPELLIGLYGGNAYAALHQLLRAAATTGSSGFTVQQLEKSLASVFADGLPCSTSGPLTGWLDENVAEVYTVKIKGDVEDLDDVDDVTTLAKYIPTRYEHYSAKCSVRQSIENDKEYEDGHVSKLFVPETTQKTDAGSKTLFTVYREKLDPLRTVLVRPDQMESPDDVYDNIEKFVQYSRVGYPRDDPGDIKRILDFSMFDMYFNEQLMDDGDEEEASTNPSISPRELKLMRLLCDGFDTVLEFLLCTAMGEKPKQPVTEKGLLKKEPLLGEYTVEKIGDDVGVPGVSVIQRIVAITERLRYSTCPRFLSREAWTANAACRAWKVGPDTYNVVYKKSADEYVAFVDLRIDLIGETARWGYAHTEQGACKYLFQYMPRSMPPSPDEAEPEIVNHVVEFDETVGTVPYLPFSVPFCSLSSGMQARAYRLLEEVGEMRADRTGAARDLCAAMDSGDLRSVNAVVRAGRVACGAKWWDAHWLDVWEETSRTTTCDTTPRFPLALIYYRMYYDRFPVEKMM